MKDVLEKLIINSRKAIDDGIYDIAETLPKSEINLEEHSHIFSMDHLNISLKSGKM